VSTSQDYQTEITVRVYEGDDPRTINNTPIGNFTIPNIPSAPRGTAIYKVIYEVDESGLLTVTAFDDNDTDRGKVEVEVNRQ
jgi:molecular chaperone DnaK (HSP70)